jgi:YidC/Oxa1 family membrane protein insertase
MNEMGKKMREIQPQLEALKKRHADDRQKLNQETMLLHQKAGINPLQGCLPQFLQMPVWIALYSTLSQSIELRGSGFGLWVKDLSLMDPFYILPILMGVSMLVTQWMTSQHSPQAASAGQQKFMLWFMPIVFTMMLSKTPSGLQLYILLSNILSMIQSKMVYRAMERKS